MKIAIVYSNSDPTDNSKLMAESMKGLLNVKNDCIYEGIIDDAALIADRIYLCFWTSDGDCDPQSQEFIKKLSTQELFVAGTAGFNYKFYLDEVIKHIKKIIPADVKLLGSFMCHGKMPLSIKEKYLSRKTSEDDLPMINKLLKNFEKALKHPSEKDLKNLKRVLCRIK